MKNWEKLFSLYRRLRYRTSLGCEKIRVRWDMITVLNVVKKSFSRWIDECLIDGNFFEISSSASIKDEFYEKSMQQIKWGCNVIRIDEWM